MNPDLLAAAAVAVIMAAGSVAGYVWALWCTPRLRRRRVWRSGPVRGRGWTWWTARARLGLTPRAWARWWRAHPELEPETRMINRDFRRAVARHGRRLPPLERIRVRIRRR